MLALLAQLGILLERDGTTPEFREGISAILGRHLQAVVESQARLRLRTAAFPQLAEDDAVNGNGVGRDDDRRSASGGIAVGASALGGVGGGGGGLGGGGAPPARDVASWLNLLEQQPPTSLVGDELALTPDLMSWGDGIDLGWLGCGGVGVGGGGGAGGDAVGSGGGGLDFGGSLGFWAA
jgi:hypothetical protein